MNGQLVISLDFEKLWGVFDSVSCKNYESNLLAVDEVIDRLLSIADSYNVKLTFSTVGLLFNETKSDFKNNLPNPLPSYTEPKHSPYQLIDSIGDNENKDSLHYAYQALKKIKANKNHEIGTHTYCHYYCLEEGQTIEQFEADLKMAIKVGKDFNTDIKSIVFPRNQVNNKYLDICVKNGILSYRGYENHEIYKPKPYKESKSKLHRALRLSDAYINITGDHIYDLNSLANNNIVNIPSSYFLRPYHRKLSFIEPLKLRRIIRGMTKAAQSNKLYHLWFHPHNFGSNMEENFKNFENILEIYSKLQSRYNFESKTMTQLAIELLNK
ncbi:polysaccharide deacetylase family protein [Pontimicrobium sp. IMCC45349]|uniref:polysaccharide deacetylase family protein n=1 Tax=Pontimicrobium sp. IMCC45349 TaxID=3391574 RepID=UPI0039A266EA